MPVVFQLLHLVAELGFEDVAGVEGIILQDLVHREEGGLVLPDDAGVGAYLCLAVREGVEGVDSFVRGHIGRKVNHYLHLVRGHVLYLFDIDFLLVLSLDYGVDNGMGGFPVRDFRDCDGGLVYLVDARPYLHNASTLSLVVLGAVRDASGGEVRQNLEGFALEDGYGCVYELVEIMGKNLGRQARGDALGALGQQEREAHRKLRGLLVAAVVGSHCWGDILVEHHFLREFREARLNVPGRGVGVSGEDVSPVSLAVYEKALLAKRDQGAKDGGVAVGMVLHGLAHDVGNLRVAAVVHLRHSVQHTPLDRFETVHDMRHGPVQDGVGRIVQIPVLEHAGELETGAVASQKFLKLPRRNSVFSQFFTQVFVLPFNVFPIFCHK